MNRKRLSAEPALLPALFLCPAGEESAGEELVGEERKLSVFVNF